MIGLDFTLSHQQDTRTGQACNPQVLEEIHRFTNLNVVNIPKINRSTGPSHCKACWSYWKFTGPDWRTDSKIDLCMIFMICCTYLNNKPICCFFAKVLSQCSITISNSFRIGTAYLTPNPQMIQFAFSTSKFPFCLFYLNQIYWQFQENVHQVSRLHISNDKWIECDVKHKYPGSASQNTGYCSKLSFLSMISTVRASLVNACHHHCEI